MASWFSTHRRASAHPTLKKVGVVAGLVMGALFLALLLTLAFMDWNALRGPLSRMASARLGRPVQIQGNLDARLVSLTPTITVSGLDVGNPRWAGAGSLAHIERLSVQMRLLPLLKGSLILPSVRIERPQLHLLRDMQGRANWVSSNPKQGRAGGPPRLPLIQRFELHAAEVTFRDPKRELDFRGILNASETAVGNSARPFHLAGSGTMNGEPFRLDVRGAPLMNVEPDKPYPLDAQIVAGAMHLNAHGSIPKPFDLGLVTADFNISGDDLADVYYISGLSLPNTPPYRLSGRMTRRGTQVMFQNLSGKVGDSDMRGDASVDVGGDRPFVRAKVTSKSLDLDDVAAWFGAGPVKHGEAAASAPKPAPVQKTAAANEPLFPDAKLKMTRVRAMNAQVSYVADAVRSGRFPIRATSMNVKLQDGVLTLDPVSLSLPQGRIEGTVRLDATADVVKTDIDARLVGVQLSQFKPKKSPEAPLDGVLRGRVKLTGRGNSVHEFVASSDGAATFVVPHGEVREAFAELTGVNVARGLGLLLSKDQEKATVRCGVADLKANDGTLSVQNMVFDTENMLITGKGDVGLGAERFDLTLKGQPKKLRLLRVKSPIAIRGPLRKPSIGLEADAKSVGQSGVAAALGALVAPLAAVVAFVDPGLAKDADCAALLAEAKSAGAPVKTAEINQASRR